MSALVSLESDGHKMKIIDKNEELLISFLFSAHIAPGISASMKTLSNHAAEGADRVSHIILGPEKHARVR